MTTRTFCVSCDDDAEVNMTSGSLLPCAPSHTNISHLHITVISHSLTHLLMQGHRPH